MLNVKRIAPCLWFDDQAEEAARHYTSIFHNSRMGNIVRYPETGSEIHAKQPGSVMTVDFVLDGLPFTALNGGPAFTFTEAISLQVYCETQEEVDYYWERLAEGGDENAQQCGWLKDRFGVSWQIVPTLFLEMAGRPDARLGEGVAEVVFKMKKPVLDDLRRAREG